MIFHHRIPGARFVMPDGRDVSFAGGSFDSTTVRDETSRKQVEFELGRIANVPSSQIYTTEKPIIPQEERDVVNEIRDSATTAFNDVHKMPHDVKTIPMNVNKDPKPTLTGPIEEARKALEAAKPK